TRIADAVPHLGGDLRARASSVFCSATPPADTADSSIVGEPVGGVIVDQRSVGTSLTQRPMPSAITTPADLAACLVTYLESAEQHIDAIEVECMLDGLVQLSYQDLGDIIAALEPLTRRYTDRFDGRWYGAHDDGWPPIPAHILAAVGAPVVRPGWLRQSTAHDKLPHDGYPAPERVLGARFDEIATNLLPSPVPFLLATPTSPTGHIDPATLVNRVATYEAAGITPWPYDLEQALLRLPQNDGGTATDAARRLRSAA